MRFLFQAFALLLVSGLASAVTPTQQEKLSSHLRQRLSTGGLKQATAAPKSVNMDTNRDQRKLDIVDDVVDAILAAANANGELENALKSDYAIMFNYTDTADFVHDVVAYILDALEFDVDMSDVQLLAQRGLTGYGDNSTTYTGDNSSGWYFNDTGNYYYNDTGVFFIPSFEDHCGGIGDDCEYPYDDYGGFSGIKGATMNYLLQDLGLPPSNESLVELTCAPTQSPMCAFDSYGNVGAWVCRTMFSPLSGAPVQWNACVDPGKKGLTTDMCGCCGGFCPAPCPCPCDLVDGTGSGTLVLASGTDFFNVYTWLPLDIQASWNITESAVCVPNEIAISLEARPTNGISCITECPL
jgi:hypothetical protein